MSDVDFLGFNYHEAHVSVILLVDITAHSKTLWITGFCVSPVQGTLTSCRKERTSSGRRVIVFEINASKQQIHKWTYDALSERGHGSD